MRHVTSQNFNDLSCVNVDVMHDVSLSERKSKDARLQGKTWAPHPFPRWMAHTQYWLSVYGKPMFGSLGD